MNAHPKEHARLLAELVASEEPDPAVAEELRACATCAPELARLEALRAALDDAGDEEARHLDAAAELADPPGANRVEDTLRALASERPGGPTRSWPGWLFALAAALLATTAWFVLADRESSSTGASPGAYDVLGTDPDAPVRLLAPLGDVDRFDAFHWEGELPRAGTWRLRVWSHEDGEVLLDERDLTANRFELAVRRTTDWPERIRWRVEGRTIDGRAAIESPDGYARRR